MADLTNSNRTLIIKRYEYQKLVALSQREAKEIRIIELEEEIIRCRIDIDGQNKIIANMDKEIGMQHEEMRKDEAAKAAVEKEAAEKKENGNK